MANSVDTDQTAPRSSLVWVHIVCYATSSCSALAHNGKFVCYFRAEHKSLDVDEECCICMENVPKVILPCTHRFCERCVAQW